MTNRWVGYCVVAGVVALLPGVAWAQNTTPGTSVHILVGQTPMVVNLPTATPDRYYDASVVQGRSYCAEATGAETEVNQTDPVLDILHGAGPTSLGLPDIGDREPRGLTAARMCFIAGTTETVYIKLSPAPGFENLNYTVRFVETTLWANWFFVSSGYSSYTLVRNTTNAALTADFRWRNDTGTVVASSLGVNVPANGVVFIDARVVLNCAVACLAPLGSVDISHNASPEAIVGSQTTLSSGTGLSFDTIMFQRRAW